MKRIADSMFEFESKSDTEDEWSSFLSNNRKSFSNKSWTEVILDKSREFNISNNNKNGNQKLLPVPVKKRKAKRPRRETESTIVKHTENTVPKHVENTKAKVVRNWIKTSHLFSRQINEASPSKNQIIDSDESYTRYPDIASNECPTKYSTIDDDESPTKYPAIDDDESPAKYSAINTEFVAIDDDEPPLKYPSIDEDESPTKYTDIEIDESPTKYPSIDEDESPTKYSDIEIDESPSKYPSIDEDESPTKYADIEADESPEFSKTYNLPVSKENIEVDSSFEISEFDSPMKIESQFLIRRNKAYVLRNPNTLRRQMLLFRPFVNLDVVIYQSSWSSKFGRLILMKDADDKYCLLRVPELESNEELFKLLSPGIFIKFTNLGVHSKTSFQEDTSMFSILMALGSIQLFYYNLALRKDTCWTVESNLDISFQPMIKALQRQTSIREIEQAAHFQDQRVCVDCIIIKRSKDCIIVEDKAGDRMKVELIHPFGYSNHKFSSLASKKHFMLDFLRIFDGTPTLDQFSTFWEIHDEIN